MCRTAGPSCLFAAAAFVWGFWVSKAFKSTADPVMQYPHVETFAARASSLWSGENVLMGKWLE